MRLLKPVFLFAILVSTSFIAVACGGGAEKETPAALTQPSPSQQPPPSTTSVPLTPGAFPATSKTGLKTGTVLDNAVSAPWYELEGLRYGGTLRTAVSYSSGNLDPKFNNQNISPTGYTYETLIIWDPNEGNNFSHPSPNLAESWDISKDLLTYTFTLRKGIKWQNLPPVNGRELVAEDAAFSLRRYMEKDSYWSGAYNYVESITAPDRYTVVIKLKEPTAWAINDLFPNIQWVVAPELVKEMNGDLGTRTIGTGAYILKQYQLRRGSRYVRNPDYWKKDIKGNPLPYMDEVTEIFITDTATALAAFRTNQIDSGGNLAPNDVIQLGKQFPDLKVYSVSVGQSYGIAFNTRVAPWNNVNLRRAINMATDKLRWIEQAAYVPGNWVWSGPFPKTLWSDDPDVVPDDLGAYYKYNPQESKKLRIEAGYPNGIIKVSSPMSSPNTGFQVSRTPVLQELWKSEGIELPIRIVDRTVYQDVYYKREWKDIGISHLNTGDWTLNWFAQNKFTYEAFQNSSWLKDPEVDKVVGAIKVTVDPAKLKEYAKFLWDFDITYNHTIWLPRENTFSPLAPRVRNNPVRQSFTNAVVYNWLADAPRTQSITHNE